MVEVIYSRGGGKKFRKKTYPSDERRKYGFQCAINAKNIRKNRFFTFLRERSCSGGGYCADRSFATVYLFLAAVKGISVPAIFICHGNNYLRFWKLMHGKLKRTGFAW